jgi:hypothetical protein
MSGQAVTFRPIYRDPYDGILTEVPEGGLLNIGGTTNPNFTVGGKAIMLADGSTSNGSPSLVVNLQTAYRNTADETGAAVISLLAGKDFVIKSMVGDRFFRVDAETGDVTIAGNLTVAGETTVVNTVVTDYDHITLTPSRSDVTAFQIRYDNGIVPSGPYIQVYDNRLGREVFGVDRYGTTDIYALRVLTDIILSEGSLVDGVDISALADTLSRHIQHTPGLLKHAADEIGIGDALPYSGVTGNVRNALEFFDLSINNSNQLVSQIQVRVDELRSDVDSLEAGESVEARGYVHVQDEPSTEWVISHGRGTTNLTYVVFDSTGKQFYPNEVVVVDENTIKVGMTAASAGRVNIIFFAA